MALVIGFMLILTGCGSNSNFDTTVPKAHIKCLKSAPAVKSGAIAFEAEQTPDYFRVTRAPADYDLQVATDTHVTQCLAEEGLAYYVDNYHRDPEAGEALEYDNPYGEEAPVIYYGKIESYGLAVTVKDFALANGMVATEITFQPIAAGPALH